MSRRLAHRPRYHHTRVNPQPLRRSEREYLRQRWSYRQQRTSYTKHSLGYGLSLVPWGWHLMRDAVRIRA